MPNSESTGTSIYYTTTASEIQAALKFTLIFDGNNHMVKTEVYNGNPSTTTPVYTKTQQLGEDDIFNLGTTPIKDGDVMAHGGFAKRENGVVFEGGLESAYSTSRIHGIIGVYNGSGPEMSRPFKFSKGSNYPSEECSVRLGLTWDDTRGDYNLNWSFEGESGTVELVEGKGSLTYMENGVEISGTFHQDLMYRFTGVFIKPGELQFGFTDAGYAGWLKNSIR